MGWCDVRIWAEISGFAGRSIAIELIDILHFLFSL